MTGKSTVAPVIDDCMPSPMLTFKPSPPSPLWYHPGGGLDIAYNNKYLQGFLIFLLFWALFATDIFNFTVAPDEHDDPIAITMCITLAIFAIEIVVCGLVQKNYLPKCTRKNFYMPVGGFFFWMDLIGTISILFDIYWIAEDLTNLMSGTSDQESSDSNSAVARASKTTRLGAKAGRMTKILRLVKIVRIVRVAKLLKYFFKQKEEEEDKSPEHIESADKIASNLSEMQSQLIAAVVMIMVIISPLLVADEPFVLYTSMQAYMMQFEQSVEFSTPVDQIKHQIAEFFAFYDGSAIRPYKVIFDGIEHVPKDGWTGITRRESMLQSYPSADYNITIFINVAEKTSQDAMFSMVLICIVIFVLVGGVFTGMSQIRKMVITPFEKIFSMVTQVVGDVVIAAQGLNSEQSEMDVLQTAIGKLGKLGARVISAQKGKNDKMEKVMANKDLDDTTKNWLQSQYTTEGIHEQRGGLSEKDRKKSIETQSAVAATTVSRRKSSTHEFIIGSLASSTEHSTFAFKLESFEHNVFDYKATTDLYPVVHWAMVSSHCVADFNIDDGTLRAFISAVEATYNPENPYHNFHHAVDTMQTLNLIMRLTRMVDTMLTQTDIFAALVAALGHDCKHPGVNAAFLINSRDELAMTYNDVSILENMHISTLYGIMNNDECNILKNLNTSEWVEVRKVIVKSILATDMQHHFKMVTDLEQFYDVNEVALKDPVKRAQLFKDSSNSIFVLECLMHSCDISNSAKPWDTCQQWALEVCEEFFRQGEKESAKGVPISPMCDRATTQIPTMQCGFIEFVVSPLFSGLIKLLPELHFLGYNLCQNRRNWGHKWINGIEKTSADRLTNRGKNQNRVKAMEQKFEFSEPIKNALHDSEKLGTDHLTIQISIQDAEGVKVFCDDDEITTAQTTDPGQLSVGGVYQMDFSADSLLVIELWSGTLVGKAHLDRQQLEGLEANHQSQIDVAVDKVVAMSACPTLSLTVLARTTVMHVEIQEQFYKAIRSKTDGGTSPRRLRGSIVNTGSAPVVNPKQRHTVATSQLVASGALGNLSVHVKVTAAKIFLKDLKRCDAFVKLYWDGHLFGNTTAHRQTLEPEWTSHNDFSIGVPIAESKAAHLLRVELWNRDYHTEDTLLGKAKFTSTEIFGSKGTTQQYQLWGDDIPTNGTDPTGAIAMSIRAVRTNNLGS